MIVGIDGGKSGGIAALSEAGSIYHSRTPLDGKEESVEQMAQLLREFQKLAGGHVSAMFRKLGITTFPEQPITIAIEAVARGSGVSSRTSAEVQGRVFGEWVGICTTLAIPFRIVRPQEWSPKMLGRKKRTYAERKAAARLLAGQLFPEAADLMRVKANDGIADALLIAEYVRRGN